MSIIRERLEQKGITPEQIQSMKIDFNAEKRAEVWSVVTTNGSQYDFDLITGDLIYSDNKT